MGKVCRRGALFFFAGLFALGATAAVVQALLSNNWVHCEVEKIVQNKSSNRGWIEFGLIRGCQGRKPTAHSQIKHECFEGEPFFIYTCPR